ncbi:hypothetical protein [Paenibacillus glacialis]|uniref:Uncharacterized protein n=1 Tax=Paenibacillus glacialis TaxID=494026 RepID=A0A168JQC9_9BACL|nr:hypothetical protein [Paenibacillus glacialis]OAB40946.1 hypothetical protein PGLA_17230 [Paenibacillus glacialis]
MRIVRRMIVTVLLLVIALVVAVIVYIRPEKELDMSYEQVDMKVKVWNMVKNRVPEIELTREEMNHLAKKKMVEALTTTDTNVKVTGVEFSIHEEELEAKFNGKWGVIPFGGTLNFHMKSNGSDLILEHTSTRIRQIEIPSSRWSLAPITVSLNEYVPNLVGVDHINFKTDSIVLFFKIDWLAIPPFLLDLK